MGVCRSLSWAWSRYCVKFCCRWSQIRPGWLQALIRRFWAHWLSATCWKWSSQVEHWALIGNEEPLIPDPVPREPSLAAGQVPLTVAAGAPNCSGLSEPQSGTVPTPASVHPEPEALSSSGDSKDRPFTLMLCIRTKWGGVCFSLWVQVVPINVFFSWTDVSY